MPAADTSKLSPGLYLLILVGSVLITLWSVYADPIINIDGILYIKAARAFAEEGATAALATYKWPFYPALIHLVHRITGLDLFASANLIDGVFNVFTCIVFVLIVAELGGSRRSLLIAALVIVLFPGLNEVRSYIIRDHAYISFYLLAFYFLLRAVRLSSLGPLLLSMAAMGMATVFRIEGAVYLIAIPYIYLYCTQPAFLANRLSLILISIALVLLLIPVLGWWLHSPKESYSLFSVTDLSNNWHHAMQFLDSKVQLIKNKVLKISSSSVSRLVYLWIGIGAIAAQVLTMFTLPYTILAGYALKKRIVFTNTAALRPWKLFLYFNIVILVLFTLFRFVLTDRYPLSLAVLLLLIIPFVLDHIYGTWRTSQKSGMRSAAYGLLALVLVANAIEGFTTYTDKRYLREAGAWLEQNLPANSTLYLNNKIVGFYSGHADEKTTLVEDPDQLLIELYKGEWINHHFVALNLPSDPKLEDHLKVALWVAPEKVFRNKKNDQVRIYDIKKYRAQEGP